MNKKIRIFIIVALFNFILLGVLVHFFPHTSLDLFISKEVQEEVNELRPIDLSKPLTYVSLFGNDIFSPISILVVSLIFYLARQRRESFFVLLVFIADAFNLLLKMIINRPRPTPDIVHVAAKFNHSSFPSGHVVNYVVFFGFLLVVLFYKKLFSYPLRVVLGSFLAVLILTIPISRVYLGAHWATDVIGGYLVGSIFLLTMLSFYFQGDQED